MEGPKLRAVIDTNVYLSAIFFDGIPETVVTAAEHKLFQAITSDFLLNELFNKLITKIEQSSRQSQKIIERIKNTSQVVKITAKKFYPVRDLKDHPVVETAEKGEANFIITGDKDLLALEKYKQIQCVKPREFLNYIFPQIK